MSKKTHEKVQWMFVGSRATESEEINATTKIRDKMARKERDLNSSYLSLEERSMPILLDEKKCQSMFSPMFGKYESLFFHRELSSDKRTFGQKLTKFFESSAEASLVVYSGNARENDGTWVIESYQPSESEKIMEESISFEDILLAWKNRNNSQKHLLIIIDANYSGHWLRQLSTVGESTITIQTSSRYWQKATEDRNVGGFFLHNLYKVVKDMKQEPIIEPSVYKQSPGFYGNFHYVMRYFGLVLKFESWDDMRHALSEKEYGNWPRIKDWVRTPFSKITDDPNYENYGKENYFIDKSGKRYEGNVDKNNNKEGFGVSYFANNVLEYEGQFKNDHKQGKGVLYDEEGYKLYEGDFVEDFITGNGKNFDRFGFVNFVGTFVNSERTGEGKEMGKDGSVIYDGNFKDGIREGKGVEYYANGKVMMEGVWVGGKLEGPNSTFNEKGILIFQGEYINGNRNGLCKTYYEDGRIHYEGSMLAGLFTGFGKIWNRGGELNSEGEFVKGRLQGVGKIYHLNGNLAFDGIFKDGKATGVGTVHRETRKISMHGKNNNLGQRSLTNTVSTLRSTSKKFQNTSFIGKNLNRTLKEKADFLSKTSNFKDSPKLNATALVRSSLIKKNGSGSIVTRTSCDIKREVEVKDKLGPLKAKGNNGPVNGKNNKVIPNLANNKNKKLIIKLEKEISQIIKTTKIGTVQKSSNDYRNTDFKKSPKEIENDRINSVSPQYPSLDKLPPTNAKNGLLNDKASSNKTDALKTQLSKDKQNFKLIYVKKFDLENEDQLKQELYGHPPQEAESEINVKKVELERESLEPDSQNPFLKQESFDRISELDKREAVSDFSFKPVMPGSQSPILKKVVTEHNFEFVGSFEEKPNLLSLQDTQQGASGNKISNRQSFGSHLKQKSINATLKIDDEKGGKRYPVNL